MNIVTAEQYQQQQQEQQSKMSIRDAKLDQTVLDIIQQVKQYGDQALLDYTEKFDGIVMDDFIVSTEEFNEAQQKVEPAFLDALQQAKANIEAFHQGQMEQSWFMNQQDGIMIGQKVSALARVGVYIPGGKAAYPSTVLMNVIPAILAGVEEIVITTPPQADGKVNPYVLAAASITGITTVYKVGGAQAIAALAYGTETIEKVAKIVGPGNAFVARAKKWVYGDVAIDMIAGPSEICVVADETAPAKFIAADLLSQAEHDEQASSICITTSEQVANDVIIEIEKQTATLERKAIIEQSLKQNGKIIITDHLKQAFSIVNQIAPEHLQLMIANPMEQISYIKNAGAIFMGNYSPEPLGDYFAGPNHTLPTSGTAAFASPLGVYDFLKRSSLIHYSQDALRKASTAIETLANVEGLTAHANAIRIRKT